MLCDYPLDNDFTLEISLTNIQRFQHCFNEFNGSLLMKIDFGITKKASINTLVVPHNDNISCSYFANVKHTLYFM